MTTGSPTSDGSSKQGRRWAALMLVGVVGCSDDVRRLDSVTLPEQPGDALGGGGGGAAKPSQQEPAPSSGGTMGADAGVTDVVTTEDGTTGGDVPLVDAGVTPVTEPSEPPLYVISTRINTTDDISESFLVTVPAIGAGTTFNLDQGVALETDSSVFGAPGQPYVYAASSTDPTITRWELQADGSLKKGPTLSFAGLGLSRADSAGLLPFYSNEKAYFIDQFTPTDIVIWNPQSMEIEGTIPLDLDIDGALLPQAILAMGKGRVYAVASWEQDFSDDWTRFGDHVRVISIDPTTDTVVREVDDPRCNSLAWATSSSDGSTYFSPSSYFSPLRTILGAPSGIIPCSLRIAPGADQFDGTFDADLQSVTGGRPAGDLFLVNDTTAYLRVWHPELLTPIVEDKSNWQDVINEAGFLWWRWQLGSPAAEQVPDQVPANGTQVFVVDGKTYTPSFSSDYTSTVVDELDPSGVINHGLSGPGQVFGVVRVR